MEPAMFDRLFNVRYLAAAAGLLLVGLVSSPASAQCEPFPEVKWWKNLSHDSVTQYVARKHQGDWQPYMDKWLRQYNTLKDIAGKDGSVVINSVQVRLKGKQLDDYIGLVGKRVAVTRCLKSQADGEMDKQAYSLGQFETASGAADTSGVPLQAID